MGCLLAGALLWALALESRWATGCLLAGAFL